MIDRLPPYLTSEVISRLGAVDPIIAKTLHGAATIGEEEMPSMSGESFLQLLLACWVIGYCEALRNAVGEDELLDIELLQ